MSDSTIHLIVSRMGMGIRRPTFYEERLNLARITLAPSLRAQTCTRFIWAVAIDSRAPSGIEERIHALAPDLEVEVWRREPFRVGLTPLKRERIAELADGRDVIITRVDDNDMLHNSFVERVQNDLSFSPAPSGLTYPLGANLIDGEFYSEFYPWFSAGLTTKTTPELELHAYRYSHTQMDLQIGLAEGVVWEKETVDPMWIRTWQASSDANSSREARVDREAPFALKIEQYGLNDERLAQLNETLSVAKQLEANGVRSKTPMDRIQLKNQILRQIKLSIASGAKEEELEALRQTMYLI